MCYSDSDDEDFTVSGLNQPDLGDRLSCSFVDCLTARETGLSRISGGRYYQQRLSSEYGTRHMLANAMLKETAILVPQMDKIFCSKWLSHRQVVFGTKCNKVSHISKIKIIFFIMSSCFSSWSTMSTQGISIRSHRCQVVKIAHRPSKSVVFMLLN